jgi:hypothetical protein
MFIVAVTRGEVEGATEPEAEAEAVALAVALALEMDVVVAEAVAVLEPVLSDEVETLDDCDSEGDDDGETCATPRARRSRRSTRQRSMGMNEKRQRREEKYEERQRREPPLTKERMRSVDAESCR